MKTFASIVDLIQHALSEAENHWVYANIDAWNQDPKRAKFWTISDVEVDAMDSSELYESDDGPLLPLSLRTERLRPWMLLDSVHGVLLNLGIEKTTDADIDLVIEGINHYRENDDYWDARARR